MDLGLRGKVAVVTGASKGIGLEVTRVLADEGAVVVGGSRGPTDGLAELVAGAAVRFVAVDLAAPDGPTKLVEEAIAAHGRLDILVNNVGAVRPRPDGFLTVSDDDWAATFAVNFFAAVRTTRAALPHLMEAAPATIVTTCSVNSVLPDPLVVDYSAAKAALANFSKSLSKEVGPRGIRVNTVSPGPVETALWLGDDGVAQTVAMASHADPAAVAAQAAAGAVTGRFTRPAEVADLVAILASDRAGNVTGADFVIDGGLVTTL